MNNESQFFRDLAKLETVEYSPPLTQAEIRQIYWDVADCKHAEPLMEFVRRIEHAHGIGVKKCKTI
jgi:hypothetical protein